VRGAFFLGTLGEPDCGQCGPDRCSLIYLLALAGMMEAAILGCRQGKGYPSAFIFLNSSVSTGTTLKTSATMP
jgi:hypothetical protein